MEPSKRSRISKHEADVRPLSVGELGIAASLFRRAVVHGQQKELVKSVLDNYKSYAVASQSFLSALTSEMSSLPNDATGSMSDAAKRLREDESPDKWAMLEFAEDGMLSPTTGRAGYVEPDTTYAGLLEARGSKQNPLSGKMPSMSWTEDDPRVPMPSELTSVLDWSTTELKLPKCAHLNLTYGEFISKAKADAELRAYAKFIMESYGPFVKNKKTQNYTQAVDFARFLCRVKFDASAGSSSAGFQRSLRK